MAREASSRTLLRDLEFHVLLTAANPPARPVNVAKPFITRFDRFASLGPGATGFRRNGQWLRIDCIAFVDQGPVQL